MRKLWLLVVVSLLLASVAFAQAPPKCCIAPNGVTTPADPLLGPTLCPTGWRGVPEPCPVPTVVPTAIPGGTYGDYTPKEIEVPGIVRTVLDLAASKWGKAIILPAFLGPLLLYVVGLLKRLLPTLTGRKAFWVTVAVGFVEMIGVVVADARVDVGEMSTVVMGVLTLVAAVGGYKLSFSRKATNARMAQGAV